MNEESNIEEPQFGLRSRDTLRPSSRYAAQDQQQIPGQKVDNKVKTLQRKRVGKKGLITKKIMQIRLFTGERESRTKLKFHHESLIMVKREAESLHEELMQLLAENNENYGDDWIADINFNLDECSSEINEYLISRRDYPPSNTMSKASIVEEYLTEISNGGMSDQANQLNKLTIKTGENSINKEALAAGKHIEIKRDQPTMKNCVSNGRQQQRASTLFALATLGLFRRSMQSHVHVPTYAQKCLDV